MLRLVCALPVPTKTSPLLRRAKRATRLVTTTSFLLSHVFPFSFMIRKAYNFCHMGELLTQSIYNVKRPPTMKLRSGGSARKSGTGNDSPSNSPAKKSTAKITKKKSKNPGDDTLRMTLLSSFDDLVTRRSSASAQSPSSLRLSVSPYLQSVSKRASAFNRLAKRVMIEDSNTGNYPS